MREKAFGLALVMCCMISFSQQLLASSIILPDATKFELVNGMVIVEAELNGNSANFILDTGSPMMILNEKNLVATDFQAKSLQGPMAGNWRHISDFAWAGVHRFDLKALTTDISMLEAMTGRSIAGLIGYEFLENNELVLDFDKQLVTLVPAGVTANFEGWTLKSELPFTFAGHLPVVEVKIGDLTFHLGIDTGANTNLLNIDKAGELDAGLLRPVVGTGLVGMAGDSHKTSAADIMETNIGGLVFKDMRFVFTGISHLQNLMENGVDGLLGFPFFKAGKFSLNYSKRTISIWE